MTKIIEAQDALAEARSFIDCISLATESLPEGPGRAIQAVAHATSEKIGEAIALLEEHRDVGNAANFGRASPIEDPYEGTRK